MKKITFLLLLISPVILCPTKSHAQMQSVMTASKSTKRILHPSTSAFTPVKSVAVNNKSIITAINYNYINTITNQSIIGSVFCLTEDDSNATTGPNYGTRLGYLPYFQVTDIEIDGNDVFFCGKMKVTQSNLTFFARTSCSNLINGGTYGYCYFTYCPICFKNRCL